MRTLPVGGRAQGEVPLAGLAPGAIPAPTPGPLVLQTDGTPVLYYYVGSN